MLGQVAKFIALSVLSAGTVFTQSTTQDFEISLKRTACYGICPVYNLKIRSDGQVIYEGEKFVRVEGKQTAIVPKDEALKLLDEMLASNYFSFQDSYTEIKNSDGSITTVTDLPTTYTSLQLGAKTKTIRDYVGAPETLKKIEARIDEVARTRRWVFLDPAAVRDLASHGFNPKSQEAEAYLLKAADYGYEDVVDALLTIGVDPETPLLGSSPLQDATDEKVIRRLIAAGANVNAAKRAEYGDRPLQRSALYGSPDGLKALIDAGADVNYADEYGETILMYTVYSGDPKKVSVALQAGANVGAKAKDGNTALSLARKQLKQLQDASSPDPFDRTPKDYPEIIKLLQAAGAK